MESPKIKACVNKELKEVKDKTLIEKLYPIQGVSQKEEEKEKKQEEVVDPAPASTELFNDSPYDYSCSSITDQSAMLFTRIWNKFNPTMEENRMVSEYIISFGFSEVEIAFREAVKYDRKKLAYVETICKKRKERAAIEKEKELARKKKEELNKIITQQRSSGQSLNLIKSVYGE